MIKYTDIQPYIAKKLISEHVHPENSDVRIFNYTQKCQYSKAWDDVTLQCRGLILDIKTNAVLARPFPKFFNYEEYIKEGKKLPAETPFVTKKMDGSLGILYWLNGTPRIATRGSFVSDQAVWATKWLHENVKHLDGLENYNTPLFEIIYPANRVVVGYDFSGLVYLGSIDVVTGHLYFNSYMLPKSIKPAEEIQLSVRDLLKLQVPNEEGFVLYYPSNGLRLKIKFKEYVRLHKIVTGVSEIGIWELLKDGKDFEDILNKVPDEFFHWVDSVVTRLRRDMKKIHGEAMFIYDEVRKLPTRKEQALAIMERNKALAGIVFALLDEEGKKAKAISWGMVRPRVQKQFKVDIDA